MTANRHGVTMDTPSSSCGSYKVTFQPLNGEETIYYAPGWGRPEDRERSLRISSEIEEAQKRKSVVRITVNKKSEIISTQ